MRGDRAVECGGSDPVGPRRRDLLIGAGLAVGALAFPSSRARAGAAPADHPMAGAVEEEKQAPPFQFGGEPPRARKSFHDLTEDEVAQFRDAVGAMRDGVAGQMLGIHSPLQWDQYVSIHALHCTQQGQGWRQVHWGWLFLPWHRCYLFFLERHLASFLHALGQDGSRFAMPYWDWENHRELPNTRWRAERGIPSPLFGFDLTVDSLSDPTPYNLALWDGYRAPTIEKPQMDPQNEKPSDQNVWFQHVKQTVRISSPAMIREYLSYTDFADFGGQPLDNPTNSKGQGMLEQNPHNMIHDWVGGRYGDNRDMGTLRYAALDPVFGLHHGNLDRIWSLYKDSKGNPIEPPNVQDWYKQWFNFVDIDGKTKSVTVEDAVKRMGNITYAAPREGDAGASHRVLVAAAAAIPPQRPAPETVTVVEAAKSTSGEPITLAPSPRTERVGGLHARAVAPAAAAAAPAHALLLFELGDLNYKGKFYVRVFVNKDDADTRTSIDDEHFIGTFGAIDSHANHGAEGDSTSIFRVPISQSVSNFYKVAPPGTPFTLRLVPVGAPKDFKFTVRKVSLKVY